MERFAYLTYTEKTRTFGATLAALLVVAVMAGKSAEGKTPLVAVLTVALSLLITVAVIFCVTWSWAGRIQADTEDAG